MDDPHYLGAARRRVPARGRVEAGLAAVAEALELVRRERSLFYEPELLRLAGALRAAAGDAAAAEAALRHGLARAREQGSAALELRIAHRPRAAAGGPAAAAEARATSRAVYAAFSEGSTRPTCARRRAADARSGDGAGAGEREHEDAEHHAVGDEDAVEWWASQRSRKAIDP